ncbi:DUF3017 domain-containing protein [Streptacidiphilus sp. PB12-B1b]|uniref:DUF3017 domain-containing protein n=1 Tax=Streptacidiphilus sp. PB12-B1b TaxID=2705012 RepID=UPI0015FD396C|nr:DUF3017 domain-containing protein [Streptacidiphilus sp. PB12-B1b]QMU79245.1 DUF3017 domain-containing protein [Streptacidiphilus sp. PB12-B1b]
MPRAESSETPAEPDAPEASAAPDTAGAGGTADAGGADAPRPKSRRHPVATTGTYPPEGSAAALGSGHPVPVRQWPIVIVLTMVGVGLAVTALNQFRPGVVTIGAALLLACVLRVALPDVGMLAVRSRFTDVLVMGVLGVAIILLALASEPDPVITLPFVNEIARFLGRGGG